MDLGTSEICEAFQLSWILLAFRTNICVSESVHTPGKPNGALGITSRWRSVLRPSRLAVYLLSVSYIKNYVWYTDYSLCSTVIRQMLVRENKRLDESELEDLKGAKRERIEEFAKLEGISFEEALERKRGFRYLY